MGLLGVILLAYYSCVSATDLPSTEQRIFAASCYKQYNFSCTKQSGLFCGDYSQLFTLPLLKGHNTSEIFFNTSWDGPSGPLLEPRNSSRCFFNQTSGIECCIGEDRCKSDPCLNGGNCTESGCDCPKEYHGHICQIKRCPQTCPDPKECVDGECKCKEGFEATGSLCTAYCSERTMHHAKCSENFTFPKTELDVTVRSRESCPNGRAKATITCSAKGGSPSFDGTSLNCQNCDLELSGLLNETVTVAPTTTKELAEEVAKLELLTMKDDKLNKAEVVQTVQVLENLLGATKNTAIQVSEQTMRSVLVTVDEVTESLNVVQDGANDEADKEEITAVKKNIVDAIDTFARALNLSEGQTVEITTKRLVLKVSEPKKVDGFFTQPLVFNSSGYVNVDKATEIQDIETPPTTITPYVTTTPANGSTPTNPEFAKLKTITMNIPTDVLDEMDRLSKTATKSMRVVFVLHQDASLLTVDKRTGQVIQVSYTGNSTGGPSPDLGKTFVIEHHAPLDPKKTEESREAEEENTRKELGAQYDCVFWDYLHKEWSSVGCHYELNEGRHLCKCSHFTSFALLMKVRVLRQPPTPDYFSLIACSVSIVCLIATILIYLVVRELRNRKPTPILLNICICLAFGYLFFLIGVDKTEKENDTFCYASALLMHTALLCAWFWMLIYSLNIYQALVKVVGKSSITGNKLFMYLFGYGVPIVIILINFIATMVLDGNNIEENKFRLTLGRLDLDFNSTYRSKYMCWIHSYSLYLAFLAPVAVILLINIVLFVITIRKLTWKRIEIQSSRQATDTKQEVFMAVTIMSMMGLAWTFGFITLVTGKEPAYTVLAVIFNILNATQGIVIFLMNCVRQEAVRALWLVPILRFCGCDSCLRPKQPDVSRTSESRSFTNASATGATTLPRESNASTAL